MSASPLRQRPAWSALTAHHGKIARLHLRELFAKDPGRGERLTVEAAGERQDITEEPMASSADLDLLGVNTIRTLSIDAVQQAQSGHPGTPMALAPMAYVLWNRVLRFDPQDPIWPGRDRFVLSNGHASMLLWSLLRLTGTRAVDADHERAGELAVKLEEIRRFRRWGSKAAGHPEYGLTSGVETTTGPLGQGIANGVGMAIAQKWLANQ